MTYLKFEETRDTGKTKVWRVENSNDGSWLGVIRWHGAWRKYVLDVQPECIWSSDCLQDVARFIESQMFARKKVPMKVGSVTSLHAADCGLMAGDRCDCK